MKQLLVILRLIALLSRDLDKNPNAFLRGSYSVMLLARNQFVIVSVT